MATGAPPPAYQDDNASNLPPAPPAYADEPPADGNATASTQNTKPSEPPPDGEGILSEPPKRMLYIGVVLLLYFILAVAMPIYWMTGAADPCGTSIERVACVDSTDSTCEDNGEAFCDALDDADDSIKEIYYESWAFGVGASSRGVRLASWTLMSLGMLFGIIAGLMTVWFGYKQNGTPLMLQICAALLAAAGILSFSGGFLFAVSFDDDWIDASYGFGDLIDYFNAWRAAGVLESLLPASIAVILGLDIFKLLLNVEQLRMLIMTAPFAICGISLGVIYAMISLFEESGFEFADLDNLYGPVACIASGYFIFGLVAAARIVIGMEWVKPSSDPASGTMIQFLMALLLVIGAFICAAGYWAMMSAAFDCDYSITTGVTTCEGVAILPVIFPDNGEIAWISEGDIAYEGRFKAYFVGYTFLVLGMTAIIAYDMDIAGNYKKVRMAQQAASAAA